jgi:hypothetical protein
VIPAFYRSLRLAIVLQSPLFDRGETFSREGPGLRTQKRTMSKNSRNDKKSKLMLDGDTRPGVDGQPKIGKNDLSHPMI